MKKYLRKIRDFYCYTEFYLGRGLGMVGSFRQILGYTAYSGIIIIMFNQAMEGLGFNLRIPMENAFFFVLPFMVLMALMGILDVKKIKSLQKLNEISIRNNPYLVNLIQNGHKTKKGRKKEIENKEEDKFLSKHLKL